MAKRKPIGKSTRWQVFARDGFCCRYCGSQAGEDGVELVIDHMVSVADGGGNEIDNLITACQSCNGGKSSRSLQEIPTARDVIARLDAKNANLAEQLSLIQEASHLRESLKQECVNIKCDAFGRDSINIQPAEQTMMMNLIKEFGAVTVIDWYHTAAKNGVSEFSTAKYVSGIARNTRAEAGA